MGAILGLDRADRVSLLFASAHKSIATGAPIVRPGRRTTIMIRLSDIEDAQTILDGRILRTPMLPAPRLSELTGAEIFVKYENLQVTNSFKERGALNKLASLLESGATVPGVIAASAGNHAQGVAHHAQRLGLRALIVMPRHTPVVKVERTRGFAAEVILHACGAARRRGRSRAGRGAGLGRGPAP